MTKNETIVLMNSNPVFHLATVEGDQPYVRGMFLYEANENEIIFHTGSFKDVYKQISKNNNVELCFNDFNNGQQVRVKGKLETINENSFKDTITEHPSRAFLKDWKEDLGAEEFYKQFIVYKLTNAMYTSWSMETNFSSSTYEKY